MARIKHIALHTDDPVKTADFYKDVFGLQELHRKPRDTGEDGVWLSDGYIYFAILKFGMRGGQRASAISSIREASCSLPRAVQLTI